MEVPGTQTALFYHDIRLLSVEPFAAHCIKPDHSGYSVQYHSLLQAASPISKTKPYLISFFRIEIPPLKDVLLLIFAVFLKSIGGKTDLLEGKRKIVVVVVPCWIFRVKQVVNLTTYDKID